MLQVKIYRHLVENEKIFRSSNITVNIMSQYNDQCAAIRESLTKAGYNGVNVNTVVASQGQYYVLSNRWGSKVQNLRFTDIH